MTRPSIRDIQALIPTCHYQVDVGLLTTPRHIENFNVDLDPDYQRGHVWTIEQQAKFMGAFIEDYSQLNPIILNDVGQLKLERTEVVDGKQRITAILDWIEGKFEAICPSGTRIARDSLDEIERRNLSMSTFIRWKVVRLSRPEVIKYYLRLNCGGTIHTEEELDRVRGLLNE